jgi:uncharacterized protein YcfL
MKKLFVLIVAAEIAAFALVGCMSITITASEGSKVTVTQDKPITTDATVPVGVLP